MMRLTNVADRLDDPTTPTEPVPDHPFDMPTSEGVDATDYLRWVWLSSWLAGLDHALARSEGSTVAAIRGLPRHWWRSPRTRPGPQV